MKNKFVSMIVAVFCIAFACLADIVISPTSNDYAVNGGGASITTSGSGSWTATTDVSWITIVRPSGNAGVACSYVVSKNNGADTRIGHITIAGNVYTVTQKGCAVTLTPGSVSVNRMGASGVVTASMDAGVEWTADVSDSWITITPATGSGATEIAYTVAPCNEVGSRIGTIRIGSEKFVINQAGIDVTLSPASTNVTKDVCVVPIQVVAMTETKWVVQPNVSWISVLDGGNGYGGSQITLAVAENPSFEKREGTVSVGSAVFTVVQSGTDDINFKILPEVATASPIGAFANVAVYATPDASWTAESLDSWIKIADGAEGKGNGNVKYVTMSNPELEPRTGHIKFTPPVYEPELDLYSGLLFWIKEQDNIEGNDLRQTTYPLSKVFDGSFSNPLKGMAIPAYKSQAYTFSFSFKVDNIDCLNRIMMIGNHSIYIAEDNMLYYHGLKTDLVIDETGEFYTVVVCVDGQHNLKLYAGLKDDELACVYSGLISGCLTFDSALGMSNFILGYATYPSTGFMQSGQYANLRFWTRALTDKECKNVDVEQDRILETEPKGAPENIKWDFYSLNGNLFSTSSETNQCAPYGNTASYFSNDVGRDRIPNHAIKSSGNGMLSIFDFGSIFDASCITNNGKSFSAANSWTGEAYYRNCGTYLPFPIEQTSSMDATYCLWLRIDSYPSDKFNIFNRRLTNNYLEMPYRCISNYDIYYYGCNKEVVLDGNHRRDPRIYMAATNNYMMSLQLKSDGRLQWVEGVAKLENSEKYGWYPDSSSRDFYPEIKASSEESRTVSNDVLTTNQWHLLSIVGRGNTSVTFYLDGVEIGNMSSTIGSFAWVPPVDGRCYTTTWGYYNQGKVTKLNVDMKIGGWNGALDEIVFYNSALSSKQIRAIYEAGLPAQDVLHTVNQGIQEPIVTPSAANVSKLGDTISVDFSCARSINWSAIPECEWLSVVGATSGTGPATITVKAASNPTCYQRMGVVRIGNKTLTVTQEALGCEVYTDRTIFPTEADEYGGMGVIEVSPEGNGSWVAESDVDWIFCYPESGFGSSDVYFFVEDMGSTAASRSGTITIGDKTIEITQRGYDLSIEPYVAEVGGNAGAGVIGVAADPGAVWEAIVDVPWITIVQTTDKVIRYTFTDNTTGETRVGHINIAGEEYTLTQTCKLDLNTTVVGQGTVTGGGKYAQGAVVTLTATPASGYEFSHWSGDMVGTEANGTVRMDTVKNVTATFIPEAAAQVLAEKKAAQGGFYTRDQIHALEVGNLVLDVDSASGTARVGVQLMETSDLSDPNSWKPVNMTQGNLDVGNDGTVGLNVKATGNAKFFKVVVPQK